MMLSGNWFVQACSGGALAQARRLCKGLVDRAAVDARVVRLALIGLLLREQLGLLLMVSDHGRNPAMEESPYAGDQEEGLPQDGRGRRELERRRSPH